MKTVEPVEPAIKPKKSKSKSRSKSRDQLKTESKSRPLSNENEITEKPEKVEKKPESGGLLSFIRNPFAKVRCCPRSLGRPDHEF